MKHSRAIIIFGLAIVLCGMTAFCQAGVPGDHAAPGRQDAPAPKAAPGSREDRPPQPVPLQEKHPGAKDRLPEDLGAPIRPIIPAPIGKTTPSGWFDDWNRASAEARRTNRPILVLFTGSDWCHWCKVLHEEVLMKPEFRHFADEKLILVYMDQPSDTDLPLRLQQTRNQLGRLLKSGNGVPSTVVLSPKGERWDGISGYDEDYVNTLKKILKKHGF